jgi:Gpi18-like mannosyltransferase
MPNQSRGSIPWLILASGLALRLVIAPLGAHPGDFATLSGWAVAVGAHGLLNIYQVSDANYPPITLALLGGLRWLYGLTTAGDPSGPVWMILLKLPAILADIGIAALVWRKMARAASGSFWLLAAVVFNPALIYLSAWWGQYDSLSLLAALAALLEALDRRFFLAGLWLGIGLMVKLQAAVIAPAILLSILAGGGSALPPLSRLARLVLGVGVPLIVCLAPYAATGQIGFVLARLVALVSGPGWLTVNALNFWYLVTLGSGNWGFNKPLTLPDSAPILAGISAHTVGLILLGAWSAAVIVLAIRACLTSDTAPERLVLHSAALFYLGVFLWPTQAHERYAFGAMVMLAGAVVYERIAGSRGRISLLQYAIVTLLHTLNLIWAAPFADWLAPVAGNLIIGLSISAAMLGVAMWILVAWSRPRPA